MRKNIFLTILFIIYSIIIISCPIITTWDRNLITLIQSSFEHIPIWIPKLFDFLLYSIMITVPIFCLDLYFIIKKRPLDFIFTTTMPLLAFTINYIIKNIIQRPRPPIELQITHPDSYSYVSSHTLVTFCVWATVFYFLNKYNLPIKKTIMTIGLIWVFVIGMSRCWLGVHNPTDIIGAIILGELIFSISVSIKERI